MKWTDVKDFLGNAAPVVGGLLGGKAGEAVGGLIASALGVEDKPDAVIDALKANPEAIIKIKELENSKAIAEIQAATQSKQIDAETERAYLDDRKNARDNEVEIVKVTGHIDWNRAGIAWLTVVGVFAAFFTLLYGNIDKNSGTYELVYMAFGALLTRLGTVYDYFFGSSQGSKESLDTLRTIAKR